MNADITIYNSTTGHPVIIGHTNAGRTLLSEYYGRDEIDWACIELLTSEDHRKFRDFHGRITDARLEVHNDQASEKRLKKLTGGQYSAP